MSRQPANYFIVKPEPLRMSPGLFRLGHDFGNGSVDGQFFQRDTQLESYLSEKRRILRGRSDRLLWATDRPALSLLEVISSWMGETYQREHGVRTDLDFLPSQGSTQLQRQPQASDEGVPLKLLERTLSIQEDFAVVMNDAHSGDRIVLLSVCFPSGWTPETLLGKNFLQIHAPVPEFRAVASKSSQMIRAMTERGPYVRFVWTVTADGRLDHHPNQCPRDPWTSRSVGYLRVERQITVPFAAHRGSLFLIRTYLYPFPSLSPRQRAIVREAVQNLPDSVRSYKGLDTETALVLQLLA